jgi:hypothetical protein
VRYWVRPAVAMGISGGKYLYCIEEVRNVVDLSRWQWPVVKNVC